MRRSRNQTGFSLVELLLVLAILGIITGIAIPSFLGQRRRARIIGDAISNSRIIAMQMETRRADTGVYGAANAHYTWTSGVASDPTFLPNFNPASNSKMDFDVLLGSTGLTYVITVNDPLLQNSKVYQIDQNGAQLYRQY